MNPPDNITLVGYWQTEQYFKNVIPKVLREFTFRFPVRATAAAWLDEIQHTCCDSAFLHVRRQDYVGLQHFHGMPSVQYYLDAVKALPAHTAVYVFSDDIPWCRQAFADFRFNFIDGTNKFEDLQLMKACKHAILANSSFSWWGCWLGDCQTARSDCAKRTGSTRPQVLMIRISFRNAGGCSSVEEGTMRNILVAGGAGFLEVISSILSAKNTTRIPSYLQSGILIFGISKRQIDCFMNSGQKLLSTARHLLEV